MTRISSTLRWRLAVGLLLLPLAGCEWLGIDDPAKLAAAKEAEGKAVGSACRHAQRAIEDCYTLNPKAQKAAVFAGWKEMDEYMRENKLEGIAPVVPRPGTAKPAEEEAAVDAKPAEKGADKSADKSTKSDKPADKAADKAGGKASH
ncbi:hypothetical protein [Mitsuaria sp. WAJ17]|uniref:hypothetical protein n=1 Tax=Mitsuaria sp. WAJ17 TaxID=2761452 RepID=UPI001C803026|nr:hypothetical protein [Mitsuaria sp. WAJ17]